MSRRGATAPLSPGAFAGLALLFFAIVLAALLVWAGG